MKNESDKNSLSETRKTEKNLESTAIDLQNRIGELTPEQVEIIREVNLPLKKRGFQKGQSGNPNGRRKGSLSKTTIMKDILGKDLYNRSIKVLKNVVEKAEEGSLDHEKMVVQVIMPFIRTQAGKENGGKPDKPVVQINIARAEGMVGRVIDGN